jgi:hypothetical protein
MGELVPHRFDGFSGFDGFVGLAHRGGEATKVGAATED